MPHVFDNQSGLNEPTLYTNSIDTTKPTVKNGNVVYGTSTSTMGGQSQFYIEYTEGQTLASLSLMLNQVSLKPHVYNAGNYYNLPSQLGDAANTVCPYRWSLPPSSGYTDLIITYGFFNTPSNKDTALLGLPLSFLRLGLYQNNGTRTGQSTSGDYRMVLFSLYFASTALQSIDYTYANYGLSLRCVAR